MSAKLKNLIGKLNSDDSLLMKIVKMKKIVKYILGVVFTMIIIFELYVYYSDYIFTYSDYSFEIIIISTLISSVFLYFFITKKAPKIILIIIAILFGSYLTFWNLISGFSGTESVMEKWKINEYEIIYLTEQYVVGQGTSPFFRLRKKVLFDLLYKNIDSAETENNLFQIGKTECLIRFDKTNNEFNLCELKKINTK